MVTPLMCNGHIASPNVSRVRWWLSNAFGTSRRKMPSDRQIYFLWAALSTLIAVGIPPTNRNLPFRGLQSLFGRKLFIHNKYCTLAVLPTLLHDVWHNQKKVPVDRQASNEYQSLIIHVYKTRIFTSIKPEVHWQCRL